MLKKLSINPPHAKAESATKIISGTKICSFEEADKNNSTNTTVTAVTNAATVNKAAALLYAVASYLIEIRPYIFAKILIVHRRFLYIYNNSTRNRLFQRLSVRFFCKLRN